MRYCSALLCLILSSCAFDGRSAPQDGGVRADDSPVSADAAVQGPSRVVAGLVARWDFNRLDNGVVEDRIAPRADLSASSTSNFVVVQEAGTGAGIRSVASSVSSEIALTALSISKLQASCATQNKYTFEIWTQSDDNRKLNNVLWLGDAAYGNLRLQSGGNQTRISSTTSMLNQDRSASPMLPPMKVQTVIRMDLDELQFIVDGRPQYTTNSPPPPLAWLTSQDMHFFHGPNGPNMDNDWSGTIYLAAFYCSFLSDDELTLHRMLGSEAR
jgi:hypothetical protein